MYFRTSTYILYSTTLSMPCVHCINSVNYNTYYTLQPHVQYIRGGDSDASTATNQGCEHDHYQNGLSATPKVN